MWKLTINQKLCGMELSTVRKIEFVDERGTLIDLMDMMMRVGTEEWTWFELEPVKTSEV